MERFRRVVRRRKKWLTVKGIWNLLLLSGAIIVIASLFHAAESIILSSAPFPDKSISIILIWLGLAFVLWTYAMFSPDLMDVVSAMLGFKEQQQEEEKEEKQTQNKA